MDGINGPSAEMQTFAQDLIWREFNTVWIEAFGNMQACCLVSMMVSVRGTNSPLRPGG